jgi:hypothetical protein
VNASSVMKCIAGKERITDREEKKEVTRIR